MGIQDRDYYREGSSFLDAWNRQGVTVWLIAVTCVVFFLQYLPGSPLVSAGRYDPWRVQDGEAWRLFTPMFLHDGLLHLFFNMLLLYLVGTRLEEVYGRTEFLVTYLLAGVFAQAFYYLGWVADIAPGNPTVGASGAISAVLVMYACNFPRQQVLLYFVIPMPVWLLATIYIGLDLIGVFGGNRGGIAYFVHLGGVVFGAVYFLAGVRFTSLFGSRRGSAARVVPRLRVVPADAVEEDAPPPTRSATAGGPPREGGAPEDSLEKRLDQVLAKVSRDGQGSLTPEEREILFRASELYKKRRK
ncbi:rhomboid family protein : Putative membrane protein OS=Singulisphaera acidiphila (strain ATCC BAA-1392 / DSM 18658 / VKM B-2454 / MOB10) GN=Sinac_5094 PE=4 SV=1: Rhomboid [Gemmataceae bacterium]|nr:rhomboid family protein : Putative membrane protein OS=Singulisphaera acidiphila (strain ATCC BAA-1392 / DSM 18658 / VKM B-2454 / MOB10) GN=Sinac_5094 PE=4 SV=1: Rhomboid [Gemmataceae bacterium]VTU01710.1 rhomboid family protein : Putative membrane protein OS=Singulisphaera acidiphila (strain ATCC BAA-1392 / DSM 18658 / VKM B-2454 / MOB10) GN=Sinac_5094 PE=4 SV=1: Rhomboid [Gemmataceae bacterium]